MDTYAVTPSALKFRARRSIAVAVCAAIGAVPVLTATATPAHAVSGFTAGDVVVYRVGAGATALSGSGAAVFLDEYTPSGTLVQSVALPTSVSGSNKPIVGSGSANSEGMLTLSANSQYLAATGYDAAVGTSGLSSSASATIPRTVALVDGSDNVNTTTALTDFADANNPRSAVSDATGTHVWVGGAAGGVRYATVGATTSTSLVSSTFKNIRQVSVANGQLYASADPTKASVTVATIGTGLPTSGSSNAVTNLPFSSAPTQPYAYSFVTLGSGTAPDTVYVADNSAGAVVKYGLSGGSWVSEGSVAVSGITGVTADDTAGIVKIFATNSGASGTSGTLFGITDSSGQGGTLTGSATTIATAGTNQAFRGVAFSPGTVFGSGGPPPPPPPPTIATAHSGLPAAIDDPTNPSLGLTVGDTNYPASQLTVTASSSNTAVAPQAGLSITGAGATRTLTVTPGTTVGYSTITLTVTAPDTTSATTTVKYGLSADLGDASDRYFSGSGNASAAIDVGGGYMVVGDDENDILRLYNETQSGPPVKTFDFTSVLPHGSTEVDIEAAARSGNTIYWTGSMSNNSSGQLAPARSTLFATTVSGSGANTTLTYVGAYSGLQTDLVNWDVNNGHGLGANYLGLFNSVNGGTESHDVSALSVEGMEFAGSSSTTAYLTFRAPLEPTTNRHLALVVPVTNINQLVTGAASSATFGAPLFWDLGGLGVRDIRANADGQYLIIAGTADGTNSSFVLYKWNGNPSSPPRPTNTSLPLIPSGVNQGSWEGIVNVPEPLSAGSSVQLFEDNGDGAWYGDTATAKTNLPADLQKDVGRVFTYSPPTTNPVVVTADNQTRVYGATDPTFTFTTTGLTGSDAFTTPPTCGVAGDDSAVGSYPIVCSGAATSGDNDSISYVAGALTVTTSPVTIIVTATPNPAVAAQPVTLSATVTPDGSTPSGPSGTVEFSFGGVDIVGCGAVPVNGSGVAECDDASAPPPGNDTVTATYSGDSSFTSGSGTVTFTVNPATYLFVNENPNGPNEIRNYRVNGDGSTTLVGSYSTGHPGSAGSWVAAERSAYASATGELYALNLGDKTVSEFSVDADTGALTLQATTASLDASAIAVNPAGTVLYAAGSTNADTANELSSYAIGVDGTVNSTPITTVTADVDGLTVSPDGSEVAGAYPGTSKIDPNVEVWTTDSTGDLSPLATVPAACPTDVRFGAGGALYAASCYAADLTAYTVGASQLTATGSTHGTSQTLAVGPDGTVFFNTSSGLQGAQPNSGSLTVGATTPSPADDYITSMSTSPDGTRLFVASFNGSSVYDYAVASDHSMTPLPDISVPAGLPSIVAYSPPAAVAQPDAVAAHVADKPHHKKMHRKHRTTRRSGKSPIAS